MAATTLRAPASAACALGACVQDYRLTQIFDAASLTGAGRITSVNLDRSLLGGFRNSMFRLTFWTNDGTTQVADFGSFDLSVLGADVVMLSGTDFAHDPSQGDLLMRIDIVRPTPRGFGGGGGPGAFTQAAAGGGFGGPAFAPAFTDPIILTPPDPEMILPAAPSPITDIVAFVPEPSTWALTIAGFGLAGAALRRRSRIATL